MIKLFKNHHPLFTTVLVLLSLFFIVAPFYMGVANGHELHLEIPLYVSFIFASILIILLAAYLYRHEQLITGRDWFHVLAWLLPVSFIIALGSAASVQSTIHSIWIQFFNVALFLVGYYFTMAKNTLRPFIFILLLNGYILILFTLSEWLGTSFVANSVVYSIGDYRIFSPLLYPNTYAALMIAFFFVTSYLTVATEHRVYRFFSSFLVIPALLSLILTYSRAGYLIFVILYLLILFVMPFIKQLQYLVMSVLAAVMTLGIYPFISRIGIRQQTDFQFGSYLLGWLILLVASALYMIVSVYLVPRFDKLLEERLTHRSFRSYARYIIPVASILMVILGAIALTNEHLIRLLPDPLENRLGNINLRQHSVLERITFYKDGLRIIEDYPLTGAGGGAWNSLYEEYQSYPYVTKDPHSYYLNHAIETGMVGLILLLAFLAFVYIRFIRNRVSDPGYPYRFVFFVFASSILLHSLVDFNMEFLYVSGFVFLCLGIMSSRTSEAVPEVKHKGKRKPQRSLFKLAYLGSMSILAVIILFFAARSVYANKLFTHTIEELNETIPADEALNTFYRILDMKPNHPHYLLGTISLLQAFYDYSQDETFLDHAQHYIDRLKTVDGHFIGIPEFEINNYIKKADIQGAADVSIYWLQRFPWNLTMYESTITLLHQLGMQQYQMNEEPVRWDQAIELYETMKRQVAKIEALPDEQLPGREFIITDTVAHIIADIYYYRGDYSQTISVLEQHVAPLDMSQTPEILRLYLSAQIRSGVLNEELYQQFIGQYPDDRQALERLMQEGASS